jgi:predicted NAD/FAD-binding protein
MTSPLEQKKLKIDGPVVITANRLADGAVVYRNAAGAWTTRLGDAAIATSAAAAKALLTAAADDEIRAVGAYAAPVTLTAGGEVRPGNLRELIRVRGPSVEQPLAS